MLNMTVCVSGGGTNLQAILDNIENGSLKNIKVGLVISDREDAYALERAKKHGIKTLCVSKRLLKEKGLFDETFLNALKEEKPDLIVLAGFLSAVPESVVKSFEKKIINIHPSLIPSFCGKGYYGLKVHEKALERGVKVTGATVHFVDEDMDTGPIILQKAVEVQPGDTPEILQKRVMEEAEWILLPKAIQMFEQKLIG